MRLDYNGFFSEHRICSDKWYSSIPCVHTHDYVLEIYNQELILDQINEFLNVL